MSNLSNLYPVQIVDVYSFNKWNAAEEKSKGTQGVIFKAGQGGYASVPENYVAQAKEVGMPYGFYWVIDSRYDSDWHMKGIKNTFPDMYFGRLGWWWDCEKPKWDMEDAEYWKTPYAGSELIEEVMNKFYIWSGKDGGTYTSPGFAKMIGWDTDKFKSTEFADKLAKTDLWVAQYNSLITEPTLFGKWKSWTFWQYRPDPDYISMGAKNCLFPISDWMRRYLLKTTILF